MTQIQQKASLLNRVAISARGHEVPSIPSFSESHRLLHFEPWPSASMPSPPSPLWSPAWPRPLGSKLPLFSLFARVGKARALSIQSLLTVSLYMKLQDLASTFLMHLVEKRSRSDLQMQPNAAPGPRRCVCPRAGSRGARPGVVEHLRARGSLANPMVTRSQANKTSLLLGCCGRQGAAVLYVLNAMAVQWLKQRQGV